MRLPATFVTQAEQMAQETAQAQSTWLGTADLRDMEVTLWQLLRAFLALLITALILVKRRQVEAAAAGLEHCRRPMRFRGEESRTVSLAYGDDVCLARGVWECTRCKKTAVPLDRALGLERNSWSPLLRQFFCLGAVLLPGGRAADLLHRLLGRRPARRTLMDIAEKEGATAAAEAAAQGALAQPHKPEKRQRWYIMLDASASHVDKAWHEAQLGVVFPEDARVLTGGANKKRPRYRLTWKRVFGCIRDWAACTSILATVVDQLRLREIASQIVVLTDGAKGLRTVIRDVVPGALLILDWYHATKHLWDCAKVLYGEGTTATRTWVKRYERMLYNGQVDAVLLALEHAKRFHRRKVDRAALDDLIGYYTNNCDRMAYDRYRKEGLLIGSGPIEGAHRHVHHQRFKLAGMRHWERERINALLNLRLIYLNGDWDAYWAQRASCGAPSSAPPAATR